jgi:hypothetical protein
VGSTALGTALGSGGSETTAVTTPETTPAPGLPPAAALGPPDRLHAPGTGYLGRRTGIAAHGTWQFFVAGD